MPFRKFLGEISQEVGEDFAFAPLRAAYPRQPRPWFGWLALRLVIRHCRPPVSRPAQFGTALGFALILFQDVERIAVMKLHAHRAQNRAH